MSRAYRRWKEGAKSYNRDYPSDAVRRKEQTLSAYKADRRSEQRIYKPSERVYLKNAVRYLDEHGGIQFNPLEGGN